MNCLTIAVLSICMVFAVQGRKYLDKRMFKVKRDTSPDSIFSSKDSITQVHTRKRKATKQKSYVFFDNRSNRAVELSYRNIITNERHTFSKLKPGTTVDINTYTTHKWEAIEVGTGKRLLICNEKKYIPKGNTKDSKATCIIKRSDQTNTAIGDKYVEMLIVVDKTVQKMHKNDYEVERYVKILVNLASETNKDKTLTQHGFKIHLIPSKIILLKNDLSFNYPTEEYNLYHACNHMNKIGNSGPKKFDHKLFLTRKEFGAGGFAGSHSMCNQYSSCSIVHDKGFSSAFVIAHGVAHSFGVTHDDYSQHSRNIMNEVIGAHFKNFKWSQKSQHAFLASIRTYNCLDNKPSHQDVYENPGQYYTMLQQCHLENNKNFTLFTPLKKNPCKELRCSIPHWPNFWRPSGQPLEGTNCATNKWCIAGECVYEQGFAGIEGSGAEGPKSADIF